MVKAEEVLFTRIGIWSTENLDIFSHTFEGPTMGLLSHQTMGAMIVMVLLGLWTARVHIWHVVQHLWRREGQSDGEELMSYRTAILGVVLGLVIMSLWLWRSGLPLWAVFVYLFGAFVIFLALTRNDRRGWFGCGRTGHVGLRLSHFPASAPRPLGWPGCWPRA